jgi:hypothetical protein
MAASYSSDKSTMKVMPELLDSSVPSSSSSSLSAPAPPLTEQQQKVAKAAKIALAKAAKAKAAASRRARAKEAKLRAFPPTFTDIHKGFVKFLSDLRDREQQVGGSSGASSSSSSSSSTASTSNQEMNLSDDFVARAKAMWMTLDVDQIETYLKWSNISTQHRRMILAGPKLARVLFMHERKQEILQEMADEDMQLEEADTKSKTREGKASSDNTDAPVSSFDHLQRSKNKKSKKNETVANFPSSIPNGGLSSPRYAANLKLPPASASMVSSIKDAKTKVTKRAAYEWSAASKEIRSKYALKAKMDKERFLKDAERIAFEYFLATFSCAFNVQSAAISSSKLTSMAKRSWDGVNVITRALYFHDGIEHLIMAKYAQNESLRVRTGSGAAPSTDTGRSGRIVSSGESAIAFEDEKQGFYRGREVICTINRYIVVKDAAPRGKFEVGRLINVFKPGLVQSSTGRWEINVVMEIVNHGKVARIAPLIGNGSEGISTVHKDDPRTVWVMLPLSLGSPSRG